MAEFVLSLDLPTSRQIVYSVHPHCVALLNETYNVYDKRKAALAPKVSQRSLINCKRSSHHVEESTRVPNSHVDNVGYRGPKLRLVSSPLLWKSCNSRQEALDS